MKKNPDFQKDELRSVYDFSKLRAAPASKYPRVSLGKANIALLDQDLAFPDNDAVNQAIRLLIERAKRQVIPARTRSRLPRMNRVKSSSIQSIGYDPPASALYVQFLTGSVYVYRRVEPAVFDEFINADLKGVFFNSKIKPRYEYQVVA